MAIINNQKDNTITMLSEVGLGKANNLDLIRFVAASLVLYSHAFPISGYSVDPLYIFSNNQGNIGHFSVAIFFIISGYLITSSYIYSNSFIKYSKSRILRIFPGLLMALLFSTFILGPIVTSLPIKDYFLAKETYEYLKSIFLYPVHWFLPGVFETNVYKGAVNGSLWTIPIEFLAYILIGILGLFCLLREKIVLSIFIILYLFYYLDVYPLSRTHFLDLEIKTIVELLIFFLAGSLVYFYKEYIPMDYSMAILSICILVLTSIIGGLNESFVFFGTYLVFYFGFSPKIKLHNFSKYGDFSYGIYVYAFPIQQAVTYYYGGSMNPLLNFLIAFPITLVLSIISWHYIEKPCISLKRIQFLPDFKGLQVLVLKIKDIYIRTINQVLLLIKRMALIISLILTLLAIYYFSIPSTIQFPYSKSNHIFSGGWLAQSETEDYRWVSGEASVNLSQPTGMSNLNIEGYIPDSFTEVRSVSVYYDDIRLQDYNLAPGQINIILPLPENNSEYDKRIKISIEFNQVHIPKKDELDQRQMSALISSIKVF